MALTASCYDTDKHGNENRLRFWLSLDKWSQREAASIFLDIDPDSIRTLRDGEWEYFESFSGALFIEYDYDAEGFPVPVASDRYGEDLYVTDQDKHLLSTLQTMFRDRWRLLSRYADATPIEWIILAREKKIPIPWLEWAEKRGLVEIGADAEKENRAVPETPTHTDLANNSDKPLLATERNTLLTIIAALCEYSAINPQERGAAAQIARLTDELGAAVSDDTVRRTLAKIPGALECRMK